jgi:hypothetical protein
MTRVLSFAAVAIVLAGIAGGCAQTSKADATTKHLSIVGIDEKATTLEQVDLGKPGFGPADELIEEAPIQDSAGTTIGKSYTVITITSGKSLTDAVGLIDCSINLNGGVIVFNGQLAMKDMGTGVTVPVVGGTGSYAGAGGTVRMQAPDNKKTNMTFDLLIPKTSSP